MEVFNQTPFSFAMIVGRIGFPGYSLTFIIKGTFELVADNLVKVAEEQLYPTGDELYADDDEGTGSVRYESDFAYYKPKADLLLVGKCYAPRGNPVPACRATFQVGSMKKSFGIFGNRYWRGISRTISDPEPFTEMDLRYENSFGGEGYKLNPVGKGYQEQLSGDDQKPRWPLPNIEDLNDLITSTHKRPAPAGLGPLGIMWQERFSKLGTYKGNWLKERWPWFPDDFDWGFFNSAPADMQVEGFLRGDETLYFENLHPNQPDFHCQLPGVRPRLFVNRQNDKDAEETEFNEVPLNLDTLWVDTEAEKMVLVWRGMTQVLSEDYEDILHTFIDTEPLAEPVHPIDYYKAQFQKHTEESEILEPAVSENVETIEPEEPGIDIEAEIARSISEMKTTLKEAGVETDEGLFEPSETDRKKEAEILEKLGLTEDEPTPVTRETVIERTEAGDSLFGLDLRGLDLSGLKMQGVDFQHTILAEASFKGADLSQANVTGADLSGADLTGATMNRAILNDTDFTGANLHGAILQGAELEDAIFDNAKISQAVLDHCAAKGASFCQADLTKASLQQSDCSTADFSNSILHETDFRGANLSATSVEDAVGTGINMEATDLTELRASGKTDFRQGMFRKCIAPYSIWESAILDEADFSAASMEGANFASASLKTATFFCADLKYARLSKADLFRANMVSMNLFQSNLEKANLTQADLRGSNLYGAEVLDAILEETLLENANLKMSKLDRKKLP